MLCDDLRDWLADVQQRHKPTTCRFYTSRSRWIVQALGARDWPDLTPPDILRALDQANRFLDGRRKAPDTIRANTIAWEQFQAWAISTGRCAGKIVEQMPPKPSGRQRERLPAREEIEQLLHQAPRPFALIYQALLLTGARPGELCAAQIADYDQAAQVISLADHKTVAKTRRARQIPVSQRCAELLTESIGDRVQGPIFVNGRGLGWTTSQLSQAFRRRRDARQLERSLVLYSARHKFATELCHKQGIEAAAAVLGHAGLQTIRRYVHHDTQQLVKYADAVNPDDLIPPHPTPPPPPETATTEAESEPSSEPLAKKSH